RPEPLSRHLFRLRQPGDDGSDFLRLPQQCLPIFRTPYLTVMDWGNDERDYAAGHSDHAPRLDEKAWTGMVANITAIA
ncbi:hypothetical protein ACC698_38920, partial [Rhizobium johnstonii]